MRVSQMLSTKAAHPRQAPAPASLKQPLPRAVFSLALSLLCLGLVAFVGPQEEPFREDVRGASLRGMFRIPALGSRSRPFFAVAGLRTEPRKHACFKKYF